MKAPLLPSDYVRNAANIRYFQTEKKKKIEANAVVGVRFYRKSTHALRTASIRIIIKTKMNVIVDIISR